MLNKFNPGKTKQLKTINTILSIFYHEKKAEEVIEFSKVKNILILDFTLMGDLVMLTSFLRILRNNIPDAKITLVCGNWGESILKQQELVDEFIIINGAVLASPVSMLKNRKLIKNVIGEINEKQYDIALEPRGDLRYIFFMHYCNATRKVSYDYTGGRCFLTDVIMPSDDVSHLVEDKLYFLKSIGCTYEEEEKYPCLLLTEKQKEENLQYKIENGIENKRIIGIHPGASLKIKQWDGYTKLIGELNAGLKNVTFIIFEGPKEEAVVQKVLEVAEESGAQAFHVKTDITRYMQMLALCDCVICNDSGAGHIAAAYGIKTFVIFGPTETALGHPYAKKDVYMISNDKLECKPCLSTECLNGTMECIKSITSERVAKLVIDNI